MQVGLELGKGVDCLGQDITDNLFSDSGKGGSCTGDSRKCFCINHGDEVAPGEFFISGRFNVIVW